MPTFYGIGALQLGGQIIRNHNGLIGRYPGADGMKTGFTCPAGFNVVATANHNGRHLIIVVLGVPSAKLRNQEAADLFDRGFAMSGGSGSLGVAALLRRGPPRTCAPTSACTGAPRQSPRPRKKASEKPLRPRPRAGAAAVAAAAASAAPLPHRDFRRATALRSGSSVHRSRRRLERSGSRRKAHGCGRDAPRRRKGLFGREGECDRRAGVAERRAERAARILKGAVRTPPAVAHKHHLRSTKQSLRTGSRRNRRPNLPLRPRSARTRNLETPRPPKRAEGAFDGLISGLSDAFESNE